MTTRLSLIFSLLLTAISIAALFTLQLNGITAMLVGIAASISIALFSLTLMTQSWTRVDRRASAAAAAANPGSDAGHDHADTAATGAPGATPDERAKAVLAG